MSIKAVSEDGALVPVRNLPADLFLQFDRQDDDQIIAELMGSVVEEYIYVFEQGGREVVGMSLAGVMNTAQTMGGITCGEPKWELSDDEVYCEISATDHHKGLTVWGNASAPRTMQTRRGTQVDSYARQKALSKAQRNAIRKVIPEKVATEMLKKFLEMKRGGRPAAHESRRQMAPPRAQQIEAESRQVDADTGEIIDTPPMQVNDPSAGHPATEKQIKAIFGIGHANGWTNDEIRAEMYERFLIDSTSDLTVAQASELIDAVSNPGAPDAQQALNV